MNRQQTEYMLRVDVEFEIIRTLFKKAVELRQFFGGKLTRVGPAAQHIGGTLQGGFDKGRGLVKLPVSFLAIQRQTASASPLRIAFR